jgi:hypothetical protein
MSENVQRRLNFVRYGLLVMTLVVFAVSLGYLGFFGSAGIVNWGAVIGRTVLYTAIAGALSGAVYFGYRSVVASQE